jgi:hypothetical protein
MCVITNDHIKILILVLLLAIVVKMLMTYRSKIGGEGEEDQTFWEWLAKQDPATQTAALNGVPS